MNNFCANCGNPFAPQANFCSSCGAVAPGRMAPVETRIVRPRSPRMIAGVCSGFALYYGWNLTLVRILFAVFTFFTSGFGLLLYLAAWVIMPDGQYALPATTYSAPGYTAPTEGNPV